MLKEHPRCFIELGNANESIYLVSGGKREMLTGLRHQACKLIRYMTEQNAANGGAAKIISHPELLNAVWGHHRISNGLFLAWLVFTRNPKCVVDRLQCRQSVCLQIKDHKGILPFLQPASG